MTIYSPVLSQCSGYPPTLAPSDCGSFPPIANNLSVQPGQTVGVCSSDDNTLNFSAINLNGGTVRICADAALTGNWNSGFIVVECGATLRFPNGLLLNNNVGIINYGTVIVSGNLNFQNAGNYFYNESDSSRLLVSGDIRTGQNSNQTAFIKNNGFISVTGTFSLLTGSNLCLGEQSEISCSSFNYMQNCGGGAIPNRVQRESNSGNATLRYSQSASIKGVVTNNNTVQIWRGTGATTNLHGCGSFGNAIVVNNAPVIPIRSEPYIGSCAVANCRTAVILPTELSYFDVIMAEDAVSLAWETSSERNSDYFELSKSSDGLNWEPIGTVDGAGNSSSARTYFFTDTNPLRGTSYYQLSQYDFDGETSTFEMRSITNSEKDQSISIHPNPANASISVTLPKKETEVSIFSLAGEKLYSVHHEALSNVLQINIDFLSDGMYFLVTENGTEIFQKIGNH